MINFHRIKSLVLPALIFLLVSCGQRTTKNTQSTETMFNPVEGNVKLMNLV